MSSLFTLVDYEYISRHENHDLHALISLLENHGKITGRCLACDKHQLEPDLKSTPCCSIGCCMSVVSICFSIRNILTSLEPIVPREQMDPRKLFDPRDLFQARGAMAESILRILEVIAESDILTEYQSKIRRSIVKMAVCSKKLPSSLFLNTKTLDLSSRARVSAGSSVYKITYQGKLVAMKQIPYIMQRDKSKKYIEELNARIQKEFLYEVLVWRYLKHDRLLPLYGVFQDLDLGGYCDPVMVSPFCKDLSAHWYLTTRLYDTPEFRWTPQMSNMVIKWMYQTVQGLSYLHGEGIAHGDLHACNLLVVEPPNAVTCFDRDILLTDFGLSVYFEATSNQQGSSRGGIFLAPEQRDPERYGLDPEVGDRPNVRTDIFSLGPLCIQLYTTRTPWFGEHCQTPYLIDVAVSKLTMPERARSTRLDSDDGHFLFDVCVPDELWRIVEMCWTAPEKRPTIDIIAQYMEGIIKQLEMRTSLHLD